MSDEAILHSPVLIGHDEALRQAAEAFQSDRMHHAWMIAGIEGVGKATLAYHIAHHVLSNGQNQLGKLDLNHRTSKLIMAASHPDMLVIGRAEDEKTGELRNIISVEEALKIASFLHKTSTHGGWRVVIINEAHALNRHGQNAILKILEEPPAHVLILITVTTPGLLLPTIRSRCRVLHLAPLDDAHMRTLLAQTSDVEGAERDNLIQLAGGSIGFALKIIRSESLPLYEELKALLASMPQLDITRLHKLADSIARKSDAESFEVITTLLIDYLRQSIRTQAEGTANHARLDRLLNLWDSVRGTFSSAVHANLDRKLAFINAMSDIRTAMA